ncbi:MAG TPA: acyltransferase [Bacteroidales bacterium]|nr:acyltransferase [Bacteroidales bacterium]
MKNYLHPHYLYVFQKKHVGFFWKYINIFFATYWKVKIGRNVSFYGKTYFKTLPNSAITIGDNCRFNSTKTSNLIGLYCPCMLSTLKKSASIIIGNNCGFSGTVIASAKSIIIGNNVRCGANTLITDTDWHTDDYRVSEDKSVCIEDNVWLGYGVKVLKGVSIGKNSLIGACSVVTKDIPPNVVAAGNPCRIIKELKNK